MDLSKGARVVTSFVVGQVDDQRFMDARGTVLRDAAKTGLIYVVMDNPELHDRYLDDQHCCAFYPDSLMEDNFLIPEEELP